MKKIIAVFLLLTLSFSLFSCGKDKKGDEVEFTDYYEYGLFYSIPSDLEVRNLSYGDITYVKDDIYFFFNTFDEVDLTEDMLISPDTTVIEYTEMYILFLLMDIDYEYDQATDSTEFEYVYSYDDGVTPDEYYRHMILRNETYIYQVTISCDAVNKDAYKDTFDRVMNSILLLG